MLLTKLKYKHLIIKYLHGDATVAEQKQVDDRIAKSSKNKQLFDSYRGLLFLTQKKKVEYNVDSAWEKVQKRILEKESKSTGTPIFIKPSNKRTIIKYAVAGVAASLVFALGIINLFKDEQVRINQFATSFNVSSANELPDGSTVALNEKSTLKYPEKFKNGIREVTIFGEAFFEVTPDPHKPFVIHASGLDVKVLGTSFNVEAYPGRDFVKVTVNTGRVLVYPSNTPKGEEESAGKLLTAGEIATYSQQSGVLFKSVNDDLNVLSWKTGVLTFKEAKLAEVFKAFEKKYQKQFIIENPEVLNQRLTARFENQSLEDALETLSLIFNLKFENKERYIMVH